MTDLTYDLQPSSLAITGTYHPLGFHIGPIAKERVRFVAAELLAGYSGRRMTYQKWRDAKTFRVEWVDEKGESQNSQEISFESLCDHLTEQGGFAPEKLNLPVPRSDWLDASLELKQPFHAPANERDDASLTIMLASPLADGFPVQPKIDREGRAFSSLQPMLLKSWLDLRTALVQQSDQFFEEDYSWLQRLFMYLNAVVSAVDTTLHQTYYRAKYHPTAGWMFDEKRLGTTVSRRLSDKLAWIGQITGRPLDDCRDEIRQLVRLKDVRNHIAHFDPPVLAFTIEDVTEWLNASFSIAKLLASIRLRLGEPLSLHLTALLVARDVEWYPSDPGKKRVPQRPDVGYASSCWPASE